MAFKGMLRHPLSVSSFAGTCQEGCAVQGGQRWAAAPVPVVGFVLGSAVISAPLFICIAICF